MRPAKQGKNRDMATSSTSWQKGQSGNPNGRAVKGRTLADQLNKEASKTREYRGQKLTGKRLLALLAFDGLTKGTVTLGNGEEIVLSEDGWLSLLKFVYLHLDGPVKPEPEPLDVVSWSPEEWRKEAARRQSEVDNTLATFSDE